MKNMSFCTATVPIPLHFTATIVVENVTSLNRNFLYASFDSTLYFFWQCTVIDYIMALSFSILVFFYVSHHFPILTAMLAVLVISSAVPDGAVAAVALELMCFPS